MALTQYIKKWDREKDKLEFEDFIKKFMNDSSSSRCFVNTAVVTLYVDGIAHEGFFIYRYE